MYKALCSLILVLLILTFVSCTNSKNEYGKEQFYSELQKLGYDTAEKEEANGAFFNKMGEGLSIIGNDSISVFEFNSSKDVDKNTKHIIKNGYGTKEDSKSVQVCQIESPHFYKMGKVVVQYIGNNVKVIQDLRSILGSEFASYDWSYDEYTFETLPTENMIRELAGVVEMNGKTENIQLIDHFIDNFSKNRTDKVTVLKYTIEGDPIIYQLIYDGEKIIYYSDTRQDEFGEKYIKKQELQSIKKVGNDYILYGESIETDNKELVFLRVN